MEQTSGKAIGAALIIMSIFGLENRRTATLKNCYGQIIRLIPDNDILSDKLRTKMGY